MAQLCLAVKARSGRGQGLGPGAGAKAGTGSTMRPAARPLLPLGSLVVKLKIQECVSDRPLGHEADPQTSETSELEMEADSGSFIPRTFQSGINPRFGRFGFSPAACQRTAC